MNSQLLVVERDHLKDINLVDTPEFLTLKSGSSRALSWVLYTQTERKRCHSIRRKKLYQFRQCSGAYNAVQEIYGRV